jgi:hypothetical protein
VANNIGSRVWYLDTASTTPIWLAQVWIKFIEWYNPANADQFQLTDVNGNPIVAGIAEAAGDTQTFNLENQYRGLVLKSLTTTNQGDTPPGSVLYVHIK